MQIVSLACPRGWIGRPGARPGDGRVPGRLLTLRLSPGDLRGIDPNGPPIAVHRQEHAGPDPFGGHTGAHHRRDAVLARHDGAVGQGATHIGDQADRLENKGVQAGVVVGATRIDPGRIVAKSSLERITQAVAVTLPALTG